MGQFRPLFVYFCPFLITISIIQTEKTVDGVFVTRTRGHMMVFADDTMELSRPPHYFNCYTNVKTCLLRADFRGWSRVLAQVGRRLLVRHERGRLLGGHGRRLLLLVGLARQLDHALDGQLHGALGLSGPLVGVPVVSRSKVCQLSQETEHSLYRIYFNSLFWVYLLDTDIKIRFLVCNFL